nr:hypothetical protein [Tanacetum cinerariifolium]
MHKNCSGYLLMRVWVQHQQLLLWLLQGYLLLLKNSSDDEDVDDQTKGSDDNEGEKTAENNDDDDDQDEAEKVNDDDDDEEDISKIDEQEATESDEGDDEATESDKESEDEETREQEEDCFDLIPRTPEDSKDDGNNKEDQDLRIGEDERIREKEEADELYRDVDINQGRRLQVSQETEDSHVTLTPTHSDGQQESSSTSSFLTNLLNLTIDPGMESIFTTGSSTMTLIPSPQSTMTPSIISTSTTASQLPIPPTPIPCLDLQNLLTFALVFHFEDRVKSLEVNFSNILDRLQDSIQRENDEFLKTIDDNMKKIIKEQVKTQVKAQVTRILPRIKESVNAQLEAEVLTISSHSSRTSYAVAANLSEMELKKILIEKMEGNKSIQRFDKQRNLYKALVEAYDADKTILDTYGKSAILKRRREDDDQEGPSARSYRGESAFAKEPVQTTCQMEEPSHLVFETDTSIDFSNFTMNRLGVDTLTPKLLAGPTYELVRGSCNSLTELEYHLEEVYKATTDQLDWVNPEGQQYPHNLLQPLLLIPNNRGRRIQEPINYDKHALWGVSHWGRRRQQFYGFAINQESALDVYSKRRIIAVTDLKIIEWHNYKHLDWISESLTYAENPVKEILLKVKSI